MRVTDALQTAIIGVLLLLDGIITLIGSIFVLFKALVRPAPKIVPKVVFITGGSSGIGESLALEYARPGAIIGLTARTQANLSAVAERCRAKGAEVETFALDVRDAKALKEAVLGFDSKHVLELIVANAGVSGSMVSGDLGERLHQLMDVNVNGVFNAVMPLVERFKARRSGQIVVVSSISGVMDFPRSLMYATSKSALNTFCMNLREILSHYGVAVNVVCPGFVQTGFTKYTIERRGKAPMLMQSDQAARIIKDGLENNSPVITFPTRLYALAFFFRSLPPAIHEFIFPYVGTTKNGKWEHIG